MTDDGYIVYKTRDKEMIIRGGINVYPAEIERTLRTHPSVFDCYVFSVPDERLGEEIAAWVKVKPGYERTSEKEIIEFAREHIAVFKIPKYVRFVDSFPISATGKVQKFKMTQKMIEEFRNNVK
jgi:fatty-acyl-CoA synthase